VLLFAGKAHPRDAPAQALIQQLYQASLTPELIGRLIVLEGYDLRLARRLVQGCDVWLNNPEYPLEACGTSGQKAGINGGVNVSVRDGWWDEGYVAGGPDGPNGFAVAPADLDYWAALNSDERARHARDEQECAQLLDILEHEVAPLYYAHGGAEGPGWLRIAKNAMKTLIPRYNSARMVSDYLREFYAPAARHGRALAARDGAPARELAAWKARVRSAWPGVRLRMQAPPAAVLQGGEPLRLRAAALLNGLSPQDVAVECELGRRDGSGNFARHQALGLAPAEKLGDEQLFTGDLAPLAGQQHFRLRMRPQHALLAHPFETGLVVWA
jgi:starch phosphorylase